MIQYNYNIISKPKASEIDGYINVILAVIWKYTGVDEFGTSAEHLETSFFPLDINTQFIPYENVTDDVVISWIEAKTDMDAIRAELEAYIISHTVEVPAN